MSDDRKLSADEWLAQPEYSGLIIMDPDGWDRRGEYWEASWGEKITREEFRRRASLSTCSMPGKVATKLWGMDDG